VKNCQVEIPIQDVYFPDKAEVLEKLHGKTIVQGRVAELTRGPEGEMFAVIEVEGLAQPVIVPVRCIRERS
jgi:hypothetical protein